MEKNNLFSEEKLNLREEYKKSAGKKVPSDFFIFSCMAEDHTLQTLGDSTQENRWPELAARRETGKLDDPLPEKTLDECLYLLISWYGTTYPELASQKTLDYALCSQLIGKFILMINDIRQLVFIKTSKSLPQIPSDEPRPEIWNGLESHFNSVFPTYAPYLMSYFKWVYAKPVERKFELPDLPPVGRYFGILKDTLRSKERDGEETPSMMPERAERAERTERPERSERPERAERPERSEREIFPKKSMDWEKDRERDIQPREPREPHEPREERAPREIREPRERSERSDGERDRPERSERERPERDNRERGSHRGDRDRGGRGRGGERDEEKGKQDKERLALLEVDKAVLALKKHSSMNEFRLRPQNSFIRRLQHKKVNAMGLKSHSVGEEDDRAVLITRED